MLPIKRLNTCKEPYVCERNGYYEKYVLFEFLGSLSTKKLIHTNNSLYREKKNRNK